MISISILASNDHKTNIIELDFFSAGYISVHYFRFEHFLFHRFVANDIFKAKFQSSPFFLGEKC